MYISNRIILRPDGQVVGGPAISISPNVVNDWSDPDGIRSCGGRWAVYLVEDTENSDMVSGMTAFISVQFL